MRRLRQVQPAPGCEGAFTLLELMVALVIIAVGILGFSGMTIMMARGTRVATKIDEAATLVQSTIEDMSTILWENLGTDSDLPAPNGLTGAAVLSEGPLNHNGELLGTGGGPYPYYRHIVVCKEGDIAVTGAEPRYCGSTLAGSYRPTELACAGLGLTSREKLLRVLVSWTDRAGRCHFKNADSLAFQ